MFSSHPCCTVFPAPTVTPLVGLISPSCNGYKSLRASPVFLETILELITYASPSPSLVIEY